MMRCDHAELTYKLTDQFADDFILKGNSILTRNTGIYDNDAIDNCLRNFVEKYDESKSSFSEKVKRQFRGSDINTCLVFAHAEWFWGFSVNDISLERKNDYTSRMLRIADVDPKLILEGVFPAGFGSAGMYHKNNKYNEIKFILLIIKFLRSKVDTQEVTSIKDVHNWLEKIALYQKYGEDDRKYLLPDEFKESLPDRKLAIANIICHVVNPDKFERIASDNHKNEIVMSFSSLIDKDNPAEDLNIDQKILTIRRALEVLEVSGDNIDFYDDKYSKVWRSHDSIAGFTEAQGLQYKKAIILYGPPGTSKTYMANKLATSLLLREYLKNKDNVRKYLEGNDEVIHDRVHRLQLHSSYSYEDFVVGVQLVEHETKAVKGMLFDICEKASKDNFPHVLILDEINRVDLSRLFGEVFSALENRGQAIEVSVGGFQLTIPDNLYVIGTMNEIDFSLERIDFALRRRFLWFYYGFDESLLVEIINQKNIELKTNLGDDEVSKFVDAAKILNHAVTSMPELGGQYQVGHTFFGEIVEIYSSYAQINNYTRLKNKLFRNDGPVSILWDISIEPILSAFFGNMDTQTKSAKLKDLRKIFFS